MSTNIEYIADDVEEFLKINEEESAREESMTMKKLLSVQDKIKIFNNIHPLDLKSIVYDLKFLRVKFKDHVVEQGSTSENIYFIIEGACQVFHNTHKIGGLNPGDSFGESGAIFGEKRSATVICSKETSTLLSFKINQENSDFCAPALASLYKNLAHEINVKLTDLNKKVATSK